ncbi:unnamed protein product [Paramecium pentaurelia]|uniref:Uncharacterized protein n=1 Tax=Paramecium pentaurelia TaxID=43138 RepID=A0A8S1S9A0_9CILI|nr:unnamed protein product [Paramecium pentaurelia]
MLIFLFLTIATASNCLNQYGQIVDYWLIFKLPKDTVNQYTGMEYYYCDSTTQCAELKYQYDKLNDFTSALQVTMEQVHFKDTNTMNVIWNDQPFDKDYYPDMAHSKGVLSASLNGQGFIINHSTPKFPIMDSNYDEIILGMPSNSYTNAQHFMCFSVTTSEIERIAQQLIIAEVITVRANSPSDFKTKYPNLYSLKDTTRKSQQSSGSLTVQTRQGLSLQVISTNQHNQVDFYASIVAPKLKVGLVVQTWGSGGLQPPDCTSSYQTFSNLSRLQNGYKFSYTKDHSKFGISLNSNIPYVCMSDINRQVSQNKRGGTAICFIHHNIWSQINYQFIERQQC